RAAERVLRQKGYRGPITVIPQFGIDPELFSPRENGSSSPDEIVEIDRRPFTIGFAGRLVPEKGVGVLVQACASLSFDFQLRIMGQGPSAPHIQAAIEACGLATKARIDSSVPSTQMPERM